MADSKAKDPAFLFYPKDFLLGVANLTMEERGQYITLLCLQHQNGHLSDKTIWLALGYDLVIENSDVMKKFSVDEKGFYYQHRLEEEIEKRHKVSEAHRIAGKLGGRPRRNQMVNQKGTQKGTQIGNGNGNINKPKSPKIKKHDKTAEQVLSEWDTPHVDVKEALAEFLEFRKTKEPMSGLAMTKAINKLMELSMGNGKLAHSVVDQSITANWTGLFPVKSGGGCAVHPEQSPGKEPTEKWRK